MRNKLICIISPSLKIGGIERALSVLANYFVSQSYKVVFISCLSGDKFYQLDERITFVEPDFKRTGSYPNKILFYPRIMQFIRKYVKAVNPDAVLAFGDWFSPLVLFALYGTQFPVFISDRTSPDYKFKKTIQFAKKWLYPQSAGFIAQTSRAAEYKKHQFGGKLNIQVIPNAIRDVKLIDVERENIILYVGRFAWEKGPERLIRAYYSLPEKHGWKLQLAGSGPLLIPMQKLVNELGLEEYVSFPGKTENVDLLFAKAKIFVLPSILEGYPNALCEAMAAGLPCICFDSIPTESFMIDGYNGLIVKADNIGLLSKTIYSLINDETLRLRLGNNAMKIRGQLNTDQIGPQVLEFMFNKLQN